MAQVDRAVSPPHRLGFLRTLRTDAWWFEPAAIGIGLSVFLGYLTVSAFLDGWAYEIGPYLTPVFEPKLAGSFDAWYFSPALLILWVPVGFRATCYYYRRAYYRSYLLSPPGCAVGDAGKKYSGESTFPLVMQNLHRFFMYAALVFVVLLWIGAIRSFYNTESIIDGVAVETGWGIGLGSIVLVINATLLMMYSFSCHSFRHLVGGGSSCFSCSAVSRARKRIWDRVSAWNESHRTWAWASLIWIVFTDVYIRLVANGHITDPNTWGGF
ncbi:MAG: succinate dehydrogenase [Chloroflexi bacterium]|nr:succinate dehydrogenase [Chloroflexota bacterium]MCH7953725.1 succinate dehydrogenase [Chloroflexota bacterium]MCI0783832.1 succinate dehydrogenase [Chloroflexota bacterium]MCI0813506.1 succinate dehydrogenase [Chloroflexota bacterium]MCI0816771.1 succinate dehydrogenase [Chloroflexota bacterium]